MNRRRGLTIAGQAFFSYHSEWQRWGNAPGGEAQQEKAGRWADNTHAIEADWAVRGGAVVGPALCGRPNGRPPWPEEEVLIDSANGSPEERALLDLAGAVCTRAWFDDDGSLHLGFSRRHRIDSPQTRQRPRGNCVGNATARWRVCLGAESERFGTTFL